MRHVVALQRRPAPRIGSRQEPRARADRKYGHAEEGPVPVEASLLHRAKSIAVPRW